MPSLQWPAQGELRRELLGSPHALLKAFRAMGYTGQVAVGASGVLELRWFFHSGVLLQACACQLPEDDRLGSILVQQGSLRARELRSLLRVEDCGFLGEKAIQRGLISPEQVCEGLMSQSLRLLDRVFHLNQKVRAVFLDGSTSTAPRPMGHPFDGMLFDFMLQIYLEDILEALKTAH